MSNRSGVIFFTILLGLISIYYLSFTFVSRSYKEKAQTFATDAEGKVDFAKKQRYIDSLWKEKVYLGQTLQQVTERELGLGLDLQGGMHVVMEVSPADIVKGMAGSNAKSAAFQQALTNATKAAVSSQSNYVDLFVKAYKEAAPGANLASLFANSANRNQININSSESEVIALLKEELNGSVDRAFKILQARVDKFGVANPNIQRLPGSNRILVELPGVDNPERVRRLLSGAAKLEFAEVYNLNEIGFGLDQLGQFLVRQDELNRTISTSAAPAADTTATGTDLASQLASSPADSSATDTSAINRQNSALTNLFMPISNSMLGVQIKDTARANAILHNPEVKAMFPGDLVFMWDRKEMSGMPGQSILPLYFIKKPGGTAPLEGDVIVDAVGDFDQFGKPEVTMRMNGEGARKWRALTGANVGRPIAIILDDLVYTAPNVTGEIPTGNSSISGNFTIDETKDMANVLKAGKLPAPTHIVEEAVVGSTLGSEAVNKGLISSLVGLLVVLVFMVVYYSKAGWIADIALFINLFFLMGIMASLGAVLTLAGIAGIVLTIGMSVDANVLIYEGIKAELEEGKPFAQAVQDGFKGALSAIIDSNVTTLLTGSILFIFGTGLVLGFATTLIIGLITSLFTAIFITKLLLDYQVIKGNKLAFASNITKNWFKDTSFDFITQRRKFYIFSAVVLVIGVLSFIFKGFGLGVDFKGGRTYTIRFEQNVNTDEVRQIFTNALGQSPEVKTFDGFDQIKLTTDYLIEDTSVEADRKAQEIIADAAANVPGNKGTIVSSAKVGPTIANDMIYNAFWAILLAIVVNFIYIFIRFRNMAFGYAALISLAHDVLVLLVIFSLFNGWIPFISLDIDQAFIGSVLTIMGYSMNDTIVIFDRIRSYLNDPKSRNESIPVIINNALNKTLSRTAVTGITTMMVLIVLMIFGGEVLRGFTFAMLVGVVVGTYSSLFIAAPLVVDALQRQRAKTPEVAVVAETTSKSKDTKRAKS
jgi:SecD/SecF fusion protein